MVNNTVSNKSAILFTLINLFLLFPVHSSTLDFQHWPTNSGDSGILRQYDTIPLALIDSMVEANRIQHQIPAVSLAIIKEGKIQFWKNYGVTNAVSQVPITEEAVFEAASITKPVFAYVVCLLAQRDIIDLDAPLYQRFPFPELEKYPDYKKMTARHVLTHVSGLPNWGTELLHTPGTQYGYSGQGFEYLTKVVAQSYTAKMDRIISRYLREDVLKPFGMTNTYFVKSSRLKKRCVDGHIENKPTNHKFPTNHEMAFGMHCNALDIAKFGIALLNREGLTEAMAQDMFTLHTLVPDEEKEFDSEYQQGHGLGLYLRESPFGNVFGHSGSNGDFKCLFEIYDDLKMGYVIMTNSDTGDLLNDKMAKYLVEGGI